MPQPLLKIREYLSSDFNAWLDLSAISSIELNEEYLIWNSRPQLPENSLSYLLLDAEENLIASVDICFSHANVYFVKHWAVRKKNLLNEFPDFIKQINQIKNITVKIWVESKEAITHYLTLLNVKLLDKRVAFFVEGNVLPKDSQNLGFCDHIYGVSSEESFLKIEKNLPVVKKQFMYPKYQSCLEFFCV
jgi:hypothetical protein